MNASQIEKNVIALVENFNKEEFVFDLLKAYGISKTSITRLKKGDFNLSKIDGEVLYKSKMLFKEVESGTLLNTIDELTKDTDSLKHNPRFVIVTDYKTLLAKDIRTGLALDTPILEIHKHFGFFLPWAGQEKYAQKNENYADRKASYKMAKLYDILVTENPNIYDDGGHNLNIFLSRLLFCFFAEDTEIFPIEGMFTDTLEQHTQKDGTDTHTFLDRLFKVLNTEDNSKEADPFDKFPYVNGGLFGGKSFSSPIFNKEARKIIIECGDLDWSEINPDIFGSMIQAVVNPAYRSGLGMHYTSVPNIMKVIEPLFLNELNEEFEKHFNDVKKLNKLINRIAKIKVFDPACGSGNFLIIAYKQLRRLEIKILARIYEVNHQLNLGFPDVYTKIKLSQFYGIELDDFAHEMAILSLWLAEHQMNKEFVSELHDYGKAEDILPLKEAGNITQGNATRLNWEDTCPKNENDEIYILGNPPYLGARLQDKTQKEDIKFVLGKIKGHNNLDYIACWFYKGKEFIKNTKSKFAIVSTNSICQGEQVSLLWPHILNEVEIGFAYKSFLWNNNAKNNAAVFCSIISLQDYKSPGIKFIAIKKHKQEVKRINAYLIEGDNIYITKRSKPLSKLPPMVFGSMPNDGGNLILSNSEKEELVKMNPEILPYLKKLVGAKEFTNNTYRWCLWLSEKDYLKFQNINEIDRRVEKVRLTRLSSSRPSTIKLSEIPYSFGEIRHRDTDAIIVPSTTSSRRKYVPIGFVANDTVINNRAHVVYDSEPFVMGVISSKMHMVWLTNIAGKLKDDYLYSSSICYNNFPFPAINQKQKEQLNLHVFEVLEEREKHSGKTLAQLYDPDKMPKGLKEAHHQLDLAIERCYRLKPFESDTERLEYLFKEYEKMINKNTLLEKPKRTRKKKA